MVTLAFDTDVDWLLAESRRERLVSPPVDVLAPASKTGKKLIKCIVRNVYKSEIQATSKNNYVFDVKCRTYSRQLTKNLEDLENISYYST